MGIVEESISFATNFLTQILIIIAGIVAAIKYAMAEIRKGNERLGKKILGPDQDGKVGKGGLLDELRTELRSEMKREIEGLRNELTNMITDSHKELLGEFRRTSMKISYMYRDLSKVEKSLEKMSGGRYVAAREEVKKEDDDSYYDDINNSNEGEGDPLDEFTRKYRKGKK